MSKLPDPLDYTFEWPVFPKDETERELRISEVAMREGADGFPDSESTILSMTENEIIGRIRRFYVAVLEGVSNKFIKLGEETANIKLFLERFNLEQMPIQLKGKVESVFTESSVDIKTLGEQAKIASKDLELFRQENGLVREPVYSEDWRSKWGVLFLAALFFLEVGLNGALVSTVVDGLIAGISVSTTVAVLNVILSFTVGKSLLPELNKKGNTITKWMAAAGCLLHVMVIIYLNLVFGVFRSSAIDARNVRSWEISEGTTGEALVSSLKPWESLSQISDIPSLFVIGIGFVFAILALLDGYNYDDPYPGYGTVHRKFTSTFGRFETAKKGLTDTILRVVHQDCDKMESKINEFEARLMRWGTIQNVAQQQFASYVSWISQIEQDANKFLNDYRAANIRGRHSSYSTKRAPAYFDSKWTFSEQEKNPAKTFSHLTQLINSDRAAFENKTVQTQQEMNSVRDECVNNLRRFIQSVDEEFEKK